MLIDRRMLLTSLPLAAALSVALAPGGAEAGAAFISRVGGEVTAANFDGLVRVAMESVNGFLGLKISVAEGEHGGLVAEEAGGLLILYMRNGDMELSFPSGYRKDGGRYFFDGFYNVIYVGKNQGISGVHLQPARTMDVDATGKPVKEFAVDDLSAAKGG
ncbi:MAG: hypothetical protein M9924_09775 [Rhizobiaceae bacterium]|nr:hypothetical protein [Rhizobiaceae bacterium]